MEELKKTFIQFLSMESLNLSLNNNDIRFPYKKLVHSEPAFLYGIYYERGGSDLCQKLWKNFHY